MTLEEWEAKFKAKVKSLGWFASVSAKYLKSSYELGSNPTDEAEEFYRVMSGEIGFDF